MNRKKVYSLKYINILLILIFLNLQLIHAQSNPSCSYTWTEQSSGTSNILYTVKAVNESLCWTAGANGIVRRTTDGGTTWINGNPAPGIINGNIRNIDALNENNALVTTSVSTNTFIYRTTNGGANWAQVYTNTGGFIFGIKMISNLNGYAFGNPVSNIWNILSTTDGGSTWSHIPTSPSGSPAEQGVSNAFFISLPNMWFGASLGSVYRSTDNGATWSSHLTPGINTYVLSLHFNSNSLGMAGSLNMVKTTDGGFSYSPLPVPGAGNIDAIEGSGNNFWFVRGSNIYRSTDAGSSWVLEYTAPYTQLHLDMVNNASQCLTGWSVGYGGTISRIAGTVVGVGNSNHEIPDKFFLYQNYPNPFNPSTSITYSLPEPEYVVLKIFDINGKEVKKPVNNFMLAGTYKVNFDASDLSTGLYVYKITAGPYVNTKKMLFIK